MEKQVSVEKYNTNYFESLYVSPDYSKDLSWDSFGDIYKQLANMVELSPDDKVIDFGCGNGELSFCLYKKYGCEIIGIDYSKDAINIANDNLEKLKKNEKNTKLFFLNSNNDSLPNLENIDCVYFCDVLEHIYNNEILMIINKLKTWDKEKLRIVVHTDNNLFLRFVRPLIDRLFIFLNITTKRDIDKRNDWENERHINLTNPTKLKKVMSKFDFYQAKLEYPEITMEKIRKQLGNSVKIPGFKNIIFFSLNLFKFLSPSFYAVYEIRKNK